MTHNTPEQDLINDFVDSLKKHKDKKLSIDELLNQNCKSRKHSDIEFISKSGIHWVIEAKSHESGDRYNTVHKIFGELLKETGRNHRSQCKYAILIPHSSLNFYSNSFQLINEKKFKKFGELIPIDTVFTFDSHSSDIKTISWIDLYNNNN